MRVVWYVCVVGVSLFKDYINQHPQCGDPSSVSYSHCVKLAKLYSVQYSKSWSLIVVLSTGCQTMASLLSSAVHLEKFHHLLIGHQ